MVIKLKPFAIARGTVPEECLSDLSIMDSFIEIRKLRAGILEGDKHIEPDNTNNHNQIFIKKYNVWFDKNEYTEIKRSTNGS